VGNKLHLHREISGQFQAVNMPHVLPKTESETKGRLRKRLLDAVYV